MTVMREASRYSLGPAMTPRPVSRTIHEQPWNNRFYIHGHSLGPARTLWPVQFMSNPGMTDSTWDAQLHQGSQTQWDVAKRLCEKGMAGHQNE